MAKTKPRHIGVVIGNVFKQLGISGRYDRARAVAAWEDVVGEQIARISTAERMVGKKLFVKVENSTWRNELIFMKYQIIEKLNRHLGSKIVEDIKFY